MADSGHELFDRVVGQYARTRPGYPEESLDWLATSAELAPGSRVLDLGAGTGKLTVALAARGYEVIAVEPLPGMRAQLEGDLPDVPVIAGSAEQIPLAGASLRAVVVAQAFHWFEPRAALSEIARVLAPAGSFVLVWNLWDVEDPAQAALDRIVSPLETGRIRHLTTANHPYGAWPEMLAAEDLDVLWVVGANPLKGASLASKNAFVVVQDLFMSETARRADIVLPAASAYEKSGTVTNVCGEVQRLTQTIKVMGTKTDLEICGLIAKEMGLNLGIWLPDKVFDEIRKTVRGYNVPLPVLATGGAAATVPLNGRVQGLPGVIQSAGDTLFTSGSLSRYSKILNSVMESPGALYGGEGPETR